MRRGIGGFGLGLLAMGAIACASSGELEEKSRVHSLRADAAAKTRDYHKAAHEQDEARELHQKAVNRAYKEGRAGEVVLPSDVPAPERP